METRITFQRLCQVHIQRLLVLIISVVVVSVILAQLFAFPYENHLELGTNDNAYSTIEKASIELKVEIGDKDFDPGPLVSSMAANLSFQKNEKQEVGRKHKESESMVVSMTKPIRLSYMISVLESAVAAHSKKSKLFSARDRELQHARLQIENSPTPGSTEGLHPSLYRNISMFLRSYHMMEKTLKVYVYKEGTKPVFHDPKLRGIYASEGWFMKLIEKNRNFITKDPRKAHLFYIPFSSLKLRNMLHEQNFRNHKDLELHLKNYIDLIARKYKFWNRTNGEDHFLVACHDWAPKITKNHMGNCIRALCNSNLVGGFEIGKDTALPATYIRTSENPVKDLGGNPPSKRPILAFFAGGMHGNLRPVLLRHWHDKEPDMKIFGPMARDIVSKTRYRNYMKSSRYCICARGYEVYTPRIVESIYYECVPVIMSDNYVPPFLEVLDWRAFSVFVLEKDVVNLREILLSISDEKYGKMQENVKMVQRHFIWHKNAVKFDLFHMILHSVWNSRVFRVSA